MKYLFVTLISATLLAGCGATGPRYQGNQQVETGKAQIVVFRPESFIQGGAAYRVFINRSKGPVLRNGGYSIVHTAPGPMEITVDGEDWLSIQRKPAVHIVAKPGDRFFIQITPHLAHWARMDLLSEDVALRQLAGLQQSD